MDVADLSAMAAVFPGVSSERRQKSPRLPEGKARSLSARSQCCIDLVIIVITHHCSNIFVSGIGYILVILWIVFILLVFLIAEVI